MFKNDKNNDDTLNDNKLKDDKLKKKIMVNIITTLRGIGGILLVPIFTIYGSIPAAIWFISFMATDWMDDSPMPKSFLFEERYFPSRILK